MIKRRAMTIFQLKNGQGKILFVCLFFACYMQLSGQSIYGDFPYVQSFLSTAQPSECTKPIPNAGTNAATFTSDGLRLTPATPNQFGTVFINNKQFKSQNGIKIEFEYMFYGGSGNGDGMTVFLFNADNSNIGASGAGLGYAYNRTLGTNHPNRAPGLAGAYLGIGFDTYGNFKGRRWEAKERRNGIVTSQSNSEVTLRGAKGEPYRYNGVVVPGMEDRYTGYPTLISSATFGGKTFTLQNNGSYLETTRTTGGNFSLAGTRKAFIEIYPHPDNGFYITVKIKWTDITTTTVINNYHYKEQTTYVENAMPSNLSGGDNNSSTTRGADKIVTLNTTAPEYLKIGFAAATGSATNIHLIKHVVITLPSAAEANPDFATTDNYTPVSFFPLVNDLAYQGVISKDQAGNTNYIDPTSFRFILADGTKIAANSHTTTAGKWEYNPITGRITFIPNTNFSGETTIYYDIKGKEGLPYTDEAYRSLPAAMTVTVNKVSGPPPSSYILINKMISPVVK
ncbi:hypothetical protein [Parabacteroides sp. PF5-9]|uniref:hypothetical protein n=1 Tax=Parabacteroides sp. PF5-9 TaxID=1742404 RepID=UPI002476425D|nr:hypothetical protein [Parabacteroides sp. PF5-9]MDH6358137.1 hypothetical protein [Parabacteroides sp. PF5-9]